MSRVPRQRGHAIPSGKCNFANLMPLMHIIFGTYHEPEDMPETYGIPEKVSHNYLAQMVSPFLPKAVTTRFSAKRGLDTE